MSETRSFLAWEIKTSKVDSLCCCHECQSFDGCHNGNPYHPQCLLFDAFLTSKPDQEKKIGEKYTIRRCSQCLRMEIEFLRRGGKVEG